MKDFISLICECVVNSSTGPIERTCVTIRNSFTIRFYFCSLPPGEELALINMATIQKQQALTVLINLLNRGVTESQIVQLINFAGEWNKYWQSSTTNGNGSLQQSVNGSNNPGSSGGNGYGGNFSVNDLIRLNLLKSTTTNLLKSARSPPDITSPTIQILSDHHQMRYNSVYQEPV